MTAQDPDRIRYRRRVYDLFSEPLEDYFNEQHPKPEAYCINLCSACWRGYKGWWIIKRGKLFLSHLSPWPGPILDIDETIDDAYRRYISEIFPGATAPIFAEWFTGELRLVSGKLLHYVHLPYASTYENDIVLQFVAGKLLKSEH